MTSQQQPITKKAVSLWSISLVYRISCLRDYWIIVELLGVFFFHFCKQEVKQPISDNFIVGCTSGRTNALSENHFQATGGVSNVWFAFRYMSPDLLW